MDGSCRKRGSEKNEFGRTPSPRTSHRRLHRRRWKYLRGRSIISWEHPFPCLPCRVTQLTGHPAGGGGSGAAAPSQYQQPAAASTCRVLPARARARASRIVSQILPPFRYALHVYLPARPRKAMYYVQQRNIMRRIKRHNGTDIAYILSASESIRTLSQDNLFC